MRIETKFGINENIWFILRGENKAREGFINSIFAIIKENQEECFTRYGLTDMYDYALRLPEEQIFATKEEAEAKLKEI